MKYNILTVEALYCMIKSTLGGDLIYSTCSYIPLDFTSKATFYKCNSKAQNNSHLLVIIQLMLGLAMQIL